MTEKINFLDYVASSAKNFLSDCLRDTEITPDFLRNNNVHIIGSTAVKMFRLTKSNMKPFAHSPRSIDFVVTTRDSFEKLVSKFTENKNYYKNAHAMISWSIPSGKKTFISRDYEYGAPVVNIMLCCGTHINDILSTIDLSIAKCAYTNDSFIYYSSAEENNVSISDSYPSIKEFNQILALCIKYSHYGFTTVYPNTVTIIDDFHLKTLIKSGRYEYVSNCYKSIVTASGSIILRHRHHSVNASAEDSSTASASAEDSSTASASASVEDSSAILTELASLRDAVREMKESDSSSIAAENDSLKNELDTYAVVMKSIEEVVTPHIRAEYDTQMQVMDAEIKRVKTLYSSLFEKHQVTCSALSASNANVQSFNSVLNKTITTRDSALREVSKLTKDIMNMKKESEYENHKLKLALETTSSYLKSSDDELKSTKTKHDEFKGMIRELTNDFE